MRKKFVVLQETIRKASKARKTKEKMLCDFYWIRSVNLKRKNLILKKFEEVFEGSEGSEGLDCVNLWI